MSNFIELDNWSVFATQDGDGNLTVVVQSETGEAPISLNADISSESDWAERFTIPSIEVN